MKWKLTVGYAAAGIVLCIMSSRANGTVLVDTLNQPTVNSVFVKFDQWLGVQFHTPISSSPYSLDSVRFAMTGTSVPDLSARIYASNGQSGLPQSGATPFGLLDVPANFLGGLSPAISAPFPAHGLISLAPDADYWVVLARTSPTFVGGLTWTDFDSGVLGPFGALTGFYLGSVDQGHNWGLGIGTFRLAINVTSVPEPSSLMLAGLGFAGIAVWGWRKRKVTR